MAKYEKIYAFNITDKIKEGKDVYLLDRKLKRVVCAKNISLDTYMNVLSNNECRYEAWIEESENENEQ